MKKILTLLLAAATLSAPAAKLVNNKQYVMVPLTANADAGVNRFVTAGSGSAVSLAANFSAEAVWQWHYVGGTSTVPGHYTLRNVATGKYLFTVTAGSAVSLTDADIAISKTDSPVTDAAVCFTDAAGQTLAITPAGALTVSNDPSAATSAFVMLDYIASQSAEEIEEAAENAVAVAYGIPDAINRLQPLLQASYTGVRQTANVLNVLYYCQTPQDIATMLVEVRRTAVRMFESDLENGATWQQISSGMYINGLNADTNLAPDGIWFGKFTDNGNTKTEDREFYLYNNSSKLYLVNDNGAITTSAEPQTLWTVAYFYGAGLAIAPVGDSAGLLLYPDATGRLALGTDTDPALIYIGEISMFGEGVNSVKPAGPTDGNGDYTGVNAIELTLRHGAVPTPDGKLTLTFSADGVESTLAVIEATDAKDPTVRTIDYDYYDNTGTHQVGSCEVDVYTIPLDKTYTDGGQYMVRVNMGAFSLDGVLSNEMAGYVSVALSNLWLPIVTPAEGSLSTLTRITISGPDGIYPNPAILPTASVDINCDGENLRMFSPYSFAEGGEFDSYNPADPSGPWFTIPVDFTTPGRYSLFIPQSFFVDNAGRPCAEFSIVWEIDEAGIRDIRVETSPTVTYDLLGRPATRGLLISKGRKQFFPAGK